MTNNGESSDISRNAASRSRLAGPPSDLVWSSTGQRRRVVRNVPTHRLSVGRPWRRGQHVAVILHRPIKIGAALIRLTGAPRVKRDSLTVLHRNLLSLAWSNRPRRQAAGPRRLWVVLTVSTHRGQSVEASRQSVAASLSGPIKCSSVSLIRAELAHVISPRSLLSHVEHHFLRPWRAVLAQNWGLQVYKGLVKVNMLKCMRCLQPATDQCERRPL